MRKLLLKHNKNRIKFSSLTIILLATILLVACSQNTSEADLSEVDGTATQVYYVNKDETKIISEDFVPKSITKEALVEEYIGALGTEPKNFSYKKTLPDGLNMEEYFFNEDGRLSLYFNSEYNNMSGISEVLCRAAIVKTLAQIDEVDSIDFYVSGQPLMGANEKPVGLMDSKNFIESTGAEAVYVTIYFSNEAGEKLVDSNLKITYDGNISIEQLIIEQLINGPISSEKNMVSTIPEGTKINKVTTKDGICYVDFNEKFLDKMVGIADNIVIYSVVNSLDELSTVNKVKFTIDGTARKNYREGIPFDNFFERKLELVEGSK